MRQMEKTMPSLVRKLQLLELLRIDPSEEMRLLLEQRKFEQDHRNEDKRREKK